MKTVETTEKSVLFKVTGRIDKTLSERFKRKDFFQWEHPPNILHLAIRSLGGDLGEAYRFLDLLDKWSLNKNITIITRSYDFVSSAAIPIFAYGNIRMANKASDTFFFHRASGMDSITEKEVTDGERSFFLFMGCQFNLSLEKMYKLANEKKKITAVEAKELGIVHKILH